MSRDAYPTPEEVQAFLEGCELPLTAAQVALLESVTSATAAEFESAVQRVMLAPASTSLRYFAPPLDGNQLPVPDLAAEPATITYQPQGSSAETLTLNTDYWCYPENAIAEGRPVEFLEFEQHWHRVDKTLRRAIQITGRWGYGTTLPYDAWQAVVERAAAALWQQVTFGETGGLLGWKNADRAEDYGLERWRDPVKAWTDPRESKWAKAVAKYRKAGF